METQTLQSLQENIKVMEDIIINITCEPHPND